MSGPFELQLRAYAEKAKGNADAVVRKVVLDIGARLIARSPVDTGRFRSNWFYNLDAASGAADAETGASEVRGIETIPLKASGHFHTITNNLPYAWKLETGHSKQAPSGMVGLTHMEFLPIVSAAAAAARAGTLT